MHSFVGNNVDLRRYPLLIGWGVGFVEDRLDAVKLASIGDRPGAQFIVIWILLI